MPSVVTTSNTTWATPKTWLSGDALNATNVNTELRDRLNALKSPAYFRCNIDEAVDYSTTSTSWVDVDASDLAATVTGGGGVWLLCLSATVASGSGSTNYRAYFDVLIDGTTRLGLDDGLISHYGPYSSVATFAVLTSSLSAGSHSFKLQWKTNNVLNTATMFAGAGTASADIHPQFWGIELG